MSDFWDAVTTPVVKTSARTAPSEHDHWPAPARNGSGYAIPYVCATCGDPIVFWGRGDRNRVTPQTELERSVFDQGWEHYSSARTALHPDDDPNQGPGYMSDPDPTQGLGDMNGVGIETSTADWEDADLVDESMWTQGSMLDPNWKHPGSVHIALPGDTNQKPSGAAPQVPTLGLDDSALFEADEVTSFDGPEGAAKTAGRYQRSNVDTYSLQSCLTEMLRIAEEARSSTKARSSRPGNNGMYDSTYADGCAKMVEALVADLTASDDKAAALDWAKDRLTAIDNVEGNGDYTWATLACRRIVSPLIMGRPSWLARSGSLRTGGYRYMTTDEVARWKAGEYFPGAEENEFGVMFSVPDIDMSEFGLNDDDDVNSVMASRRTAEVPVERPCASCGNTVGKFEQFPNAGGSGILCLDCYANSPEGRRMPTADEVVEMWGGPVRRRGSVRTAALFLEPEHAANPPETWQVVKVLDRLWNLTTKDGGVLQGFPSKGAAEEAKRSGFFVDLYNQEKTWYAGGSVPGWRPYADVKREGARTAGHGDPYYNDADIEMMELTDSANEGDSACPSCGADDPWVSSSYKPEFEAAMNAASAASGLPRRDLTGCSNCNAVYDNRGGRGFSRLSSRRTAARVLNRGAWDGLTYDPTAPDSERGRRSVWQVDVLGKGNGNMMLTLEWQWPVWTVRADPYPGGIVASGESGGSGMSSAESAAEKFVAGITTEWWEQQKQEAVARYSSKTAMPNPADSGIGVGAIFVSSWGYDQTNVDFYEVIKLTPAGFKVREVAKSVARSSGSADYVVPQPGNYVGEEMTKRLSLGYGRPAFNINSYSFAQLWDGEPEYQTASGWGH